MGDTLQVCRKGDMCSGHQCWPPRPSAEGSPNVFVNGIPWHRVGDAWQSHCCGVACHASTLATGSETVFVNGRRAGRVTDKVKCGSVVVTGSSNVFCG